MKKGGIALGGLFAALHVLFLFAGKLILGSELILVLFLPLLSTIYTLKSDKKNVVMFVVVTILICLFFDIVNTFIYVIPSLICGIIYGVLRKNKFQELELLCLSGLTHMFSIALSFFVIVLLFKEISFLTIFEKAFSLKGDSLIVVSLLFLLVLGFCEGFLVHIITDNELAKFFQPVEKNQNVPKWYSLMSLLSCICYVVASLLWNKYSVFPLVFLIIFFIPYIIKGIMNFKYKFITLSLVIAFSFISLMLLKYIEPINYLVLPLFIFSPFIVNNFKKTFKTIPNAIK